MTQRQLLKNNRVFYGPGLDFYILATLTANVSSSASTISVTDSADLQDSGYIIIGNPSASHEIIYYSSKTTTTLTIPTGGRGTKGTTAQSWNYITYPYIRQEQTAPNNIIEDQGDTELAGWYVNPNTKQASLRVFNAPVILPGVIRFKENSNGVGGLFQGCTTVAEAGVTWVSLNAEKGDQGDPGIIGTLINMQYLGPTDTATTGLIFSNVTTNVAVSNIEVRSIISGNTTINQQTLNTCNISSTASNIVIAPVPQPYSWDLTSNTSVLKGTPSTDSLLNSYGTVHTYLVAPGTTVTKGQVVTIKYYTNTASPFDTFLTVEPLTYTNISELDTFKLVTPYNNLGVIGIAKETVDASSVTNIITSGDRKPVRVAMDGMAIIKISQNVDSGVFIPVNNVLYTGRPCLLSRNGYGFNNQSTPSPTNVYLQLGYFMETGSTVTADGNYALIKLMPLFTSY